MSNLIWEDKIKNEDKLWFNARLEKNPEEINIRLKDDFTPLVRAVHKKTSLEFIRFLLEKGADVNALTEYDDSAFCWAVSNNQINVAKLLVEYGANIHHKRRGQLNMLRERRDPKMFEYLLSIGVQIHEGMVYYHRSYESIIIENMDVIEKYLDLQSEEFKKWFKSKRLEKLLF
jgi:ankyrin repeat protein